MPAGVKHPNQLLAALRRAAPYLGHTGLLPLMEELFRWTQPQDWAPGASPIVWPSNDDLANALGCSERHVSRLIATAIEARLIVARDGSDRRRRGYRENGRIVWAWGLDLRPMAAHYIPFLEAAEAGELARRQCRTLRRQAGAARQSLAQLLAFATQQDLPTERLEAHAAQADALCAGLRRMEDLGRLRALATQLQALADDASEWLGTAVNSVEMSGSADSDVGPILPTNKPTEPEGITVIAREAEPVDNAHPVASAPTPVSGGPSLTLSAEELVRLAPRLEAYLPTAKPHWGQIPDAASLLAQHLGIPKALYAEACQILGRQPAAVAIAVISAKKHDHFHSAGPGGYLRGMLRRAREGALRLDRSIFGLREAAGYRMAKPTRQRFQAAGLP